MSQKGTRMVNIGKDWDQAICDIACFVLICVRSALETRSTFSVRRQLFMLFNIYFLITL